MNEIKRRIIAWLAGQDLYSTIAELSGKVLARDKQLRDLRDRISSRDAGVVPGPHLRRGSLPDATFVGIHDYGKGVTREEAMTFSRIALPKSGVAVSVDDKGAATVTRDGQVIVVLPAKPVK